MAEAAVAKPTKLEKMIARRNKRDAAATVRYQKQVSLEEEKKRKAEQRTFLKDFKILFAKFRRIVKCTPDRWNRLTMNFTYKGNTCTISYDKWKHEGWPTDPDDYDDEGMHWVLHCPFNGPGQSIVYDRELNRLANDNKPVKDYSNEVIKMLAELMVNLTYVEVRNLTIWFVMHVADCPRKDKADFVITQSGASGIGANTYVECTCGEKKDITDYGSW